MSGRDQATAVALLMAAAELLRDPNSKPVEKHRMVGQIEAFLQHEPVSPPVRVMHRFKPGILDGDEPPGAVAPEDFICENVNVAWAIGMDELPPPDVRERMPPHTICAVCFPDAPRAA